MTSPSFSKLALSSKQKLFLFFIIGSILILRLLSLGIYELADTTESRYASIAMRMVLSKNWITPQYFFEPFWAKPPLSFWATAISFKIFGFSEFAARLPHFLIMILLTGYSYLVLKRKSSDFALITCSIFICNLMWVVLAGSVMTDAYLVFGLSIMMLSFYQLFITEIKSRKIGYLFFIGLAIAMLAKGPLGMVIAGLSIAIFLLINKGFINGLKEFFDKLPFISGSLLAMIIFVPWYVMAEIRTPGFLNYFIIGEHFNRFLVSGWTGDRYGHAHKEPIFMIWAFFLLAIFPWSLYLIAKIFKKIATHKINESKNHFLQFISDKTNLYFLVWALIPLVFFTMARNIIIPYAALSLLPFSILLGNYFNSNNFKNSKVIYGLFLIPILFLTIIIISPNLIGKHSDKKIVQEFANSKKEILAAYKYKPKHSTYFYSRDKIVILKTKEDLGSCYNCFVIIDNLLESEQKEIRSILEKNNSVAVVGGKNYLNK